MEWNILTRKIQIVKLIVILCVVCLYADGKHRSITCSTEKRCQCSKWGSFVFANCSGLNLKLSPNFTKDVASIDLGQNLLKDIPFNLPHHLTHLNLAENPRIKAVKSNAFTRLLNLRHLVLSRCNLKHIDSGAFEKNRKLEHLDISDNQELTLSVLRNISFDLRQSQLKYLFLNKVQCTYGITTVFRFEYIKHLKNTPLKKMSIASNRITYFEHNVLGNMPSFLEEINVEDNYLSFGIYLFQLNRLKSLKYLNASFQSSFHKKTSIYNACNDSGM
ncbi:toll-like receptor 4, partial [Saccostrea cucullata]|uniref:toll-like receptor 4 n=1 Tax=Saccostrea cuccullata TaxID=36930 RepID=UPI002ED5548F